MRRSLASRKSYDVRVEEGTVCDWFTRFLYLHTVLYLGISVGAATCLLSCVHDLDLY